MTETGSASSEPKTDHTLPEGAWQFDEAVTSVFDDMLRRSIPQYDVMRATVTDLAAMVVDEFFAAQNFQAGSHVVDLGCSRGDALAPLIDRFGARLRYRGVDVSEPMLDAARARFDGFINPRQTRGFVRIENLDLRTGYPVAHALVTLAVLTLIFIPLEHRQRVLRNAYEQTAPGGALIVVEKVLGDTARLTEMFDSRYLRMKAEHGYSADEIERKRLSLEGVLVSLTAAANEEMIRRAGFEEVDCFWRWCSFAGWIARKERR